METLHLSYVECTFEEALALDLGKSWGFLKLLYERTNFKWWNQISDHPKKITFLALLSGADCIMELYIYCSFSALGCLFSSAANMCTNLLVSISFLISRYIKI